jgi:hypothetical protein
MISGIMTALERVPGKIVAVAWLWNRRNHQNRPTRP